MQLHFKQTKKARETLVERQGFLTVCALYAQFSEDQNSGFKPWGVICLVSAQ